MESNLFHDFIYYLINSFKFLFGSFKFTKTRVLEKLIKKLMKKEIVNLKPLCRFQPNARPTKLRRNYTCRNFSSIA